MKYPVLKPEDQWRSELSDFEYEVLREAATERPFSGELLHEERVGTYYCRGCGARLFSSPTKFDAGCGWPSFYEPTADDAVELKLDRSHGRIRTEVCCANCGSHLGHVFEDAPSTPTGSRYCINSVCLSFEVDQDASSGGIEAS